MSEGERLARAVVADSDRIERAKREKALTVDEVRTLQGAAFLRQIAPYLFLQAGA